MQRRTAQQTGKDIFAAVLFDDKMNFSPALEIMNLQEIFQAELSARFLKNHSQDSSSRRPSSDGNVS